MADDVIDIDELFEPADYKHELAPGVRLLEVTAEWEKKSTETLAIVGKRKREIVKFDPPRAHATIAYDVHGWTVTLKSGDLMASAPPVHLEVTGASSGSGITYHVLRAIPLADARRRIKAIARLLAEQMKDPWYIADRLNTEREWAEFAQAYAEVVARGERQPVTHLAKALRSSRNTISARVRVARDKGLLTRPTPESLGELTSKARRVLGLSD